MTRKMKHLASIHIIDLKLRAIIGIYDWEKRRRQDIIINATIDYDAGKAVKSDQINDAVDYKKVKKSIIELIKNRHYQLLEKLAAEVLDLITQDPRVTRATVRVDKPRALRYARSVAVEMRYP